MDSCADPRLSLLGKLRLFERCSGVSPAQYCIPVHHVLANMLFALSSRSQEKPWCDNCKEKNRLCKCHYMHLSIVCARPQAINLLRTSPFCADTGIYDTGLHSVKIEPAEVVLTASRAGTSPFSTARRDTALQTELITLYNVGWNVPLARPHTGPSAASRLPNHL